MNNNSLIIINLQETFNDIFIKMSNNNNFINKEFKYFERKYSDKNRYYHNLTHIYEMIDFLSSQKSNISDFDSVIIAVFYHDIIYNSLKNNNEEKSARKAYKILSETKLNEPSKIKIKNLIIRTKNHFSEPDTDNFDAKLFLDADIKILSAPENRYLEYMLGVRKEYAHVPCKIYKIKRTEFLKHIITRENIYKTDICRKLFQEKAKKNILNEIDLLKNDKNFK